MNASGLALRDEKAHSIALNPKRPVSLLAKDFQQNKFGYYAYLREHLPVHQASIMGLKIYVTARYDDSLTVTKDPRFLRNRTTVTGGGPAPFPLPKSIQAMSKSMIMEDDPEHRRLRTLVQKAFAPKHIANMSEQVEEIAQQRIDELLSKPSGTVIDLQREYALTIPSIVISRMMGVNAAEMETFQKSIKVLSTGFSGWNVLRTLLWDLRSTFKFMRELIERKREQPGDDILSAMIQAEEEGERLSEEELVSMSFLLIVAGFETTVHLITNGTIALLTHPQELDRLRGNMDLLGSAVEEMLRYAGPIHGTKMNYPKEDIELAGVRIPKGRPVMPLLGSANRDPAVFADPERFDIARDPNKHLAFSQGNHFCLGAFLARMETKLAFKVLLDQVPQLRLAVAPEELKLQRLPGWHRYQGLPVYLR